MYITINDIIGEARIDLSYQIKGGQIEAVSMLSDNVQYLLQGSNYRSVAQNGQENCVE